MPGKKEEDDPLQGVAYGDLAMEAVQSSQVSQRQWTPVSALEPGLAGQVVLLRGRVHSVRGKGKMGFLVLRERGATVQCVLAVTGGEAGAEPSGEAPGVGAVSKGMVKYAVGLSRESVVEVGGLLVCPQQPVESCTQQLVSILSLPPLTRSPRFPARHRLHNEKSSNPLSAGPISETVHAHKDPKALCLSTCERRLGAQVEVQLHTIHAITRAAPALPLSIEDAARSEKEIEEGEKVPDPTRPVFHTLPAFRGRWWHHLRITVS